MCVTGSVISYFQVGLNSLKRQGEDREDIMCLGKLKSFQTNVGCFNAECVHLSIKNSVGWHIFSRRSCACSSPVHASTRSPWGAASDLGKRNANRPRTRSNDLYVWFFRFRTSVSQCCLALLCEIPSKAIEFQQSWPMSPSMLSRNSTCRLMAQPSRTLLTNMHLTGSGREMTVFISPMILRLP